VDGLVLNYTRLRDWRIQYLAEQKKPFVSLERSLDEVDFVGVEVDPGEGYAELLDYLIGMGHSRIAFVGAWRELKIQRDRFAAFEQCLSHAAVLIDPALVLEGDLTLESGYQAAQRLFSLNRPPTAVVCVNDLTAIGADSLSCALDSAGAAWCWGTAASRGEGPSEVLPVPTPVPGGHHFTALSVGSLACAIATDGSAWCWGAGLPLAGGADASSNLTPVRVRGGHTFTAISAGSQHACALDAKGRAGCWGDNAALQLGSHDDGVDPLTPQAVQGEHSFSAIAAGGYHSCALDADGRAWCWGDNSEGALARDPWSDSALESSASPLPIQVDPPMSSISAGSGHTCALSKDGQAWCWGTNTFGALDGASWEERTDDVSPRAAPGVQRYTAIFAGDGQTCAIDTNGIAWCWGELLDGFGLWSEQLPAGPTALDPATLPLG
jgi:alpha-tubulin suppressor-like RCC1 family protein